LTLLNEPDRQAAVANIKAAADSLRALGGRTLVIHAGSEDDAAHSEAAERLSKGLRSVLELFQYCRTLGLTLAVEDMLPHLVGGRTADMQWLLSRIPDNIRVCLDTGHSFLSRDLIGRVNTFGPRLSTIHAHDNKGIYDDHLPPGEGDIPWPLLFDALVRAHFSGEIVLEVIDRPGEPDLLQRAWRSVPFLQSLYQPHAILPPAPADSR
ncbi:MAG: sugar phosphate isomerase/epimerase, partial [Chloroflexi bacterium]|nr:sugar phosphate isomerase/epimerase [Chloroflexota bacterium]